MINVAINGFGMVGRKTFCQMLNTMQHKVRVINSITEPKQMVVALIKMELQSFPKYKIKETKEGFTINEDNVLVIQEHNIERLPWGKENIDIVMECTSYFATKKYEEKHRIAGAKKVFQAIPYKIRPIF